MKHNLTQVSEHEIIRGSTSLRKQVYMQGSMHASMRARKKAGKLASLKASKN
jgi:hypothetical protein